jgi:phosphoglycolate phosphatase
MKKYRYLLWDLDGTLIYSHPGIYACIRYALKEMGREEPKMEQLRQCIGPSLMYSFSHYFGMNEQDAAKATEKYREEYTKTGVYQNEPIEGALEGLQRLREAGYQMALATSKPAVYAKIITERWGFDRYLVAQAGCGLCGGLSTKGEVIAEAMKQMNATKEETLIVGDRIHDLEGARENGIDCALLRVGYAPDGELETIQPEYIFDGFSDLTEFLLQE